MPFKNDKQRRWMFANKPALARKWQREYMNNGGQVSPNTEAEMLIEQHKGQQKPLVHPSFAPVTKQEKEIKPNHLDPLTVLSTLIDFTPVIGDVKAAGEAGVALYNKQYLAAGILAAGAAVGLIPGVGDALAAPFKAAAKIVGRVYTKIIKGLSEKLNPEQLKALGNNPSLSAGRASLEIIKAGGKEDEIIKRHIAELTAEAEASGLKVTQDNLAPRAEFDKTLPNTGPGSTGTIYIPEIKTKADYLTTLEEFEHGLNAITATSNPPTRAIHLLEEIRAKSRAVETKRVPVSPEELRVSIGDTFKGYVGALFGDINDMVAKEGLTPNNIAQLRELAAALPDKNHKLWSYAGIKPLDKNKILQLDQTELTRIDNVIDNVRFDEPLPSSYGARVATPRKVAVMFPDGTIQQLDATPTQIAEQTGKSRNYVTNRLNAGKGIDDGENIYVEIKPGESPADAVARSVIDKREKTLDTLIDPKTGEVYEGTVADYAREMAKETGLTEAAIRKRLAEGKPITTVLTGKSKQLGKLAEDLGIEERELLGYLNVGKERDRPLFEIIEDIEINIGGDVTDAERSQITQLLFKESDDFPSASIIRSDKDPYNYLKPSELKQVRSVAYNKRYLGVKFNVQKMTDEQLNEYIKKYANLRAEFWQSGGAVSKRKVTKFHNRKRRLIRDIFGKNNELYEDPTRAFTSYDVRGQRVKKHHKRAGSDTLKRQGKERFNITPIQGNKGKAAPEGWQPDPNFVDYDARATANRELKGFEY